MTASFDLFKSLSASVDAYQAAQDAMVAAGRELAGEATPAAEGEVSEGTETGDNGIPA